MINKMEELYIAMDKKEWTQVYNILKNCFKNYYTVLKHLDSEEYNIKDIIKNIQNIDLFFADELMEVYLYNIDNK